MQLVKFREDGKWADIPGLPQITVKAGCAYSVSDYIANNVIKARKGIIVGKIPDKAPEPEIKETEDIGPVIMSNKEPVVEPAVGPVEKDEKPRRWKRKKK